MTSRRIALIGGHGKIALMAAPLLADAGYELVSIIRDPKQSKDVEEAGATPLVADVERLDDDETDALLTGFDAVVWSAGAGGGNPERTRALDRDAAIRTMHSAKRVEANRYVMVSYFGAGPDHGVPEDDSFFPYAQAKSDADAALAGSGLDYTILRPSRLTDAPAHGAISVGPDQPKTEVPRADVAVTIVAALNNDASIGKAYEFNTGDEPIAQAIG